MRTAPRIAAGVAAALALFVIFFLLLPEFINVKPMKAHVIEALSRSAGVRVQAARIDISFIPRPSITLIGGTISGQVSGGFESLSIYPRILPLFRGEARIAGLDVKGPDIRVPLPEKSKIAQGVRPFSLRALEDEVTPIVSRALIRAPGLVVSVEKGRLTLFEGNDQAFRFGDMDGRLSLRGKRAEITIACTSNIWGRASLRGWLDPKGFKGEARLELMRFVADPVVQRLFPSMDPRLQDTLGDLTVRLRVDGADALSAEVESRMDRSTLRKGDEILALQQVRLKGAFRQDGGKTTISVSDFESLYPALGMSGQLALDPASSHATADVCSRYMDVGGARKIALFFAGRVPVLQRVFDVVREGRISGINLSAHGDSLLTMMEMTHIAGQGTLTGGRIILPESGLPIDGIKGDMVLAHGFLEGTNLAARMGESRGTKGKLRLELGKDSGFRLDIDVNADLAQLPFYMRRLAPTSAFVREMGMVRSPRGTAEGRVIFDSLQKKPLQTIVDVPSFTLHAGYDRFPQPMDVRGGRFHYDSAGRQIAVQNLSGKAGASSFSGLSAQLALGQEPYLAITSGAASVFLREIYPWLRSMGKVTGDSEKMGAVEGTIKLDALSLKGPVLHPREWQFQMRGEVENVTLRPAGLPGPVEAKAGRFDAGQDTLSFSGLRARSLDASLVVSGDASHYLEEIDRVDLTFQGEMGDRSVRWVSDFVRLPEEVRVRAPLSISKAHLLWEKGRETSFSGDLKVQNGPLVSVSLLSRPGELTVKPLLVSDATSRASLIFDHRKKEFDIAFEGLLAATTVDAILVKQGLLTGWIKGSFSAHLIPDQPSGSIAAGSLEGAGLTIPRIAETSLKIGAFHVKAKGNSASVRSDFTTLGQTMDASGEVTAAGDGFALDIDLSTDGLDLERIAGQLRSVKTHDALGGLPLEVTVRLRPRYVSYGKYLWKQVRADITFHPADMDIIIREADICGIDTPGRIRYHGGEWAVEFVSASKAKPSPSAPDCLFDGADFTGVFGVSGEVTGKGRTEGELMKSLRGKATFSAKDGRIYRFTTLAKIFEIASLTVIYRMPDVMGKGFAYDSAEATLEIGQGKITINRGVLNAPSANLIWKGDIDPIQKKIDGLVLVIPFTTVDRIIKEIPLVRYVLADRLVAIPVRVVGDLGQPTVTPLSPSAVGSELLGMAVRVLKLPLKIIESVLPRSLDGQK